MARNNLMFSMLWKPVLCLLLANGISSLYIRMSSTDLMKCTYGERGSLTAICVNATPSYFKSTTYRFDNLDETLRCSNCTLKILDSGTFDISGNQIKYLDLQFSKIDSIRARAFVGLIFLQKLNLAHNEIKSIYPGTFTGVKKISEIDLSSNLITTLSADGFLELIDLKTLNLRNNMITLIHPKAFNGLNNLQILDLQHNEINSAKDVFNNLSSLQSLNLNYNRLANFNGTEFDNLTSLLEVTMSRNNINAIPVGEFASMTTLRRLDLSRNEIEQVIAGSFHGLDQLESLDLSYNKITDIPQKTLQNLPNLRNFNASYNHLKIFQTGLYSGLPQLRTLNLSHNAINELEITGVFSLHSLDTLDMGYNNISDFDYVALIFRLPRISYLNLEDNLLPCDLENEMQDFFSEDNFKFILYRNEAGSVKCVDAPSKKHSDARYTSDSLTRVAGHESSGGSHIWIVVFLCVIIVLISVLYYAQYRVCQELQLFTFKRRSQARMPLMSSDLEQRDNDFLKE